MLHQGASLRTFVSYMICVYEDGVVHIRSRKDKTLQSRYVRGRVIEYSLVRECDYLDCPLVSDDLG